MEDITDEQWCFLDLLMRAREKGINRVNRLEILNSPNLPIGVGVKLVWAALTIGDHFVIKTGVHDFSITERGVALYNFKFGKGQAKARPSEMADQAILLPGPEYYKHS